MLADYNPGSRLLLKSKQLFAAGDWVINGAYKIQIHLYSKKQKLDEETLEEFKTIEFLKLNPEEMDREQWAKKISAWVGYFELVSGLKRTDVVYEVYLVDSSLTVVYDKQLSSGD